MNKDFKISFNKTKDRGAYYYHVCVSYVGRHPGYMEAIDSIIEKHYTGFKSNYCLFKLDLSVNLKGGLYGSIPVDDEDIEWDIKSSCNLEGFFNKALMKGIGEWEQSKKLKGIGHATLCIILRDIIKNKILTENDIISLEASGFIPDMDMTGLVRYYERLGFKQYLPEYYDILLAEHLVPMSAKISDILEVCSKAEFSDEIKNLLQGM